MVWGLALIQTTGAAPWASLLPMILILGVFYLVVFVPQARQRKRQRQMIASLSKGDQVVTIGGLVGEVVQVREDVVHLRTGQAVVAVERARISRRTGGKA